MLVAVAKHGLSWLQDARAALRSPQEFARRVAQSPLLWEGLQCPSGSSPQGVAP